MTRTPPANLAQCHYCSGDLDTREYGIFQFANGWLEQRRQGGANALVLPNRVHHYACAVCIDRLRHHISPSQMSIYEALPLDLAQPKDL